LSFLSQGAAPFIEPTSVQKFEQKHLTISSQIVSQKPTSTRPVTQTISPSVTPWD